MKKRIKNNKSKCAAMLLCAAACAGVFFGCGRSDALPEDRQWSVAGSDALEGGQTKLSMIDPQAYAEAADLELEPGTKMSLIMKRSGSDAYWAQVREGAKAAARDLNDALGYKGDDEIDVRISGPSTAEDAEDQINLLDEELDMNPSAIIISLIDAAACEVQFDLAAENGIPIVTLDSGSAYGGIVTTCSTDNQSAAVRAANELCQKIGDEGEVALIVHDSISETAQIREQAFRKEIEENHPDVQIVDVLHGNKLDVYKEQIAAERSWAAGAFTSAMEAEQDKAGEIKDEEKDGKKGKKGEEEKDNKEEKEDEEDKKVQEGDSLADASAPEAVGAEDISDQEVLSWMLYKHPELKGIFVSNDRMCDYLFSDEEDMERFKTITIVGFDAGKAALDRLDAGLIDGLIVQNPYGMGYSSVIAAARTILGEANESVVDTGYEWVTRDNVTGKEIRNLLYE